MSKNKSHHNKKTNKTNKTDKTNKTNNLTSSFLKTEPESSGYPTLSNEQCYNNNKSNKIQKDVDEIMLKYLNLKTKLNSLWNKFD